MPRITEKNEVALYKYNKLRFSFLNISAESQQILTNDPWSFLNSYLQNISKNKRSNNRKKIERALYFASLAEDFYKTAENAELPAKGTLLYYGMLDLVKCYLSLNDVLIESVIEHHGLSLPIGKKTTIEIKTKMKDATNIFASFSEKLGNHIKSPLNIDLKHALSNIPEIHGIFSSLNTTKRKLLPINVTFKVNNERTKIFTELSFNKEQESKTDITKFLQGKRGKYFNKSTSDENQIIFRSNKRKNFTSENMDRIFRNILDEYKSFDIVTILTRQGYRYYVDLRPGHFHHLAYSLIVMFYLGTAARYRPTEIKTLLNSDSKPLISEFISLTPKQFLYQMVSIITGKECIIPFSAV